MNCKTVCTANLLKDIHMVYSNKPLFLSSRQPAPLFADDIVLNEEWTVPENPQNVKNAL